MRIGIGAIGPALGLDPACGRSSPRNPMLLHDAAKLGAAFGLSRDVAHKRFVGHHPVLRLAWPIMHRGR
jgi:hypothetical protein